jgi:hypothetical protein
MMEALQPEVRMTYLAQVGLPLALAAAIVGGCGRAEESSRAGARADSASLAASAAASAERRVTGVMIGSRIGPGNRITEPTFQFTPPDTVYVSVSTQGSRGSGEVSAAWRSQSGEILEQTTQPVRDGQNTAFQLSRPKGLKPGTYKVVVFLGGDSVDTKVFVVKR